MKPAWEGHISSIRQRLLNLSRQRNEDFQFILSRYAVERLLLRISQSSYKDQFVLKGAQLFLLWTGRSYRQTRDLDLLGLGDSSPEKLGHIFEEISQGEVEPDGLSFDQGSISISPILDDQEYGGLRIKLTAHLGKARIPLQIDIGFGDVIIPEARTAKFPTLLGMSEPLILVYTQVSVIAEKLHTMVDRGMMNSRMKDFFDLHAISKHFSIEGSILVKAIGSTFKRRRTEIPHYVPLALTPEFSADHQKRVQWEAFIRKNKLQKHSINLNELIREIKIFISEPLHAATNNTPFDKEWKPGGPWKVS